MIIFGKLYGNVGREKKTEETITGFATWVKRFIFIRKTVCLMNGSLMF